MMNKIVLVGAIALVVAGCEPTPQTLTSPVSPQTTTVPTTGPSPTPLSTPTSTTSPTSKPTVKPTIKPTAVKQSRPVATLKPKAIPRPTSKPAVTRSPVTSGSAIPSQSGSCKELRARGIENIDVKANPWAKGLDRDKDGIACESN